MPVERIPLVGVANQRSIDGQNSIVLGKDQRFLNCKFDAVKNPITGKTTFYVEKRDGWQIQSLVSAGDISTGNIKTDILNSVVSAFGTTNSTIYDNQTSVGAITGVAIHFYETQLGAIGYVMIRSSDGTGWYYASDSKATLAYTGTTHTNTMLDSLGSTAGMYSGQLVSKADIPANTRILSVDSSTSVTLTQAATGSSTSAVTKTPIAKILDADFITTGTNLSSFAAMNGYLFNCNEDGYVYQPSINTVHTYASSDKIQAGISPDFPVGIARHKNSIVCFKRGSTEFFSYAGNPTGSVLNQADNLYKRIGAQNQRSIAQLRDDIFVVSSSRDGDLTVEKLSNFAYSTISTPAISKILGTANATGNAIYASAFTLGGYSYLSLQVISSTGSGFLIKEDGSYILQETNDKILPDVFAALARQLVYNIDLNLWSEWDSSLMTFVKGIGSGSVNQIIASSLLSTSGKVYQINPSSDTEVYTDDGTAYSMRIQTSAFDFGTDKRKFVNSLTWVGDESAGTLTVETNDNDFDSSSWVTRGTIDLSSKTKRLSGVGSHKGKRAYRFTHSDNYPVRAEAVDIDYTIGLI